MIASAVVRPGDLTRRDALKIKAAPAMKISLGSIPILIIAGLIEGFVTPLQISPWIKLVFAVFTGIMLAYYIYCGSRVVRGEEKCNAEPVSL